MESIEASIQKKLNGLNALELEEVNHFLSSYKKSPTTEQNSAIPMYFLGRFLGIRQVGKDIVEMSLGIQNENTYGVAQGGSIYT